MLSHSHFNTGVQTHDAHAGASHVPVIRQQCHVDQRNAKRLSRGSTTCTFCSDLLLDIRHASQYHYQSLQTPSSYGICMVAHRCVHIIPPAAPFLHCLICSGRLPLPSSRHRGDTLHMHKPACMPSDARFPVDEKRTVSACILDSRRQLRRHWCAASERENKEKGLRAGGGLMVPSAMRSMTSCSFCSFTSLGRRLSHWTENHINASCASLSYMHLLWY